MVLVVKDIIVIFRKNETILILISLKRYFLYPEKSILKDTDFDTAAHATRASSVNKLTSTSKTYVLIRAASVYRLLVNGR